MAASPLATRRPFDFVRVAFLGGLFATFTGCAGRVVAPPAPGLPTEPRASWIIRAGTEFGSEREVCRSDRDKPCVLQASTDARPMHVVVSVYLYPADGKTTYSGAFLSGFTQSGGGKGHETKVDYTVEQGRRPSFISSSGRATSVLGTYQFRMALLAEVPGHTDPHQFEQVIPVQVTAPRSATT